MELEQLLSLITFLVLLILISPSSASFAVTNGTDKTREEYAMGQEVVESVVRKLR
ncbi:unnamed protein product, partial [Allacma fusca]